MADINYVYWKVFKQNKIMIEYIQMINKLRWMDKMGYVVNNLPSVVHLANIPN